jgi:hypothetical protein
MFRKLYPHSLTGGKVAFIARKILANAFNSVGEGYDAITAHPPIALGATFKATSAMSTGREECHVL